MPVCCQQAATLYDALCLPLFLTELVECMVNLLDLSVALPGEPHPLLWAEASQLD